MKKRILVMLLGISILATVGCKATEQSENVGGLTLTEGVTPTESPAPTEGVTPTEMPTPTKEAGTSILEGGPFDLEKIKQSGQEIQDYYAWSVANYDNTTRKIELGENASAELVMELESVNDTEVGYMIFIDGIPQVYGIGEQENYLIPLECMSGVSEEKLTFTPTVSENTEEHTAYFVCINRPGFRVSGDNMDYGNYHSMSQMLPWKISGNFSETDSTIAAEVTYQPIPEEIKEQYTSVNRDGTVRKRYENTLYSMFYQNGAETERFDGRDNTQLVLFGGPEGGYRIRLFVDQSPVAAFSGADYVDVLMENEQMAVVDLDLSEAEISDYSCMYAILCPISSGEDAVERMVEKTKSITLFP